MAKILILILTISFTAKMTTANAAISYNGTHASTFAPFLNDNSTHVVDINSTTNKMVKFTRNCTDPRNNGETFLCTLEGFFSLPTTVKAAVFIVGVLLLTLLICVCRKVFRKCHKPNTKNKDEELTMLKYDREQQQVNVLPQSGV